MKNKNFISVGRLSGMLLGAAFCTAMLLPAGCSNDSETNAPDSNGRVPLKVTGSINVQTRAHDAQWDKDDQIGIYMYAAGTTTIAEDVTNIPYRKTDTGNGFTPVATTIYFPTDGSNVDFHTWYPYKDVGDSEWTADFANQTSQAALDLMTADAKSDTQEGGTAYNKDNPAVALNFSHRLTKLWLNIAPGTGISTEDLKGLKVELTRQWKAVIYDPEYDALGFTEELATIPLLTAADGTSAEAILFPDDLTHKPLNTGRQLIFTLKSTNEVFRWDIPADKSFNAVDKNIYDITINRSSLDVTATISDWNKGNGGGEPGSAE